MTLGQTASNALVLIILLAFFLIIYSRMRKQSLTDSLGEIKDFITGK